MSLLDSNNRNSRLQSGITYETAPSWVHNEKSPPTASDNERDFLKSSSDDDSKIKDNKIQEVLQIKFQTSQKNKENIFNPPSHSVNNNRHVTTECCC